MALGFSGSNGGMARMCRAVVLADVDAGIRKYETLLDGIPRAQETTRNVYEGVLEGLRGLREKVDSSERKGR